MSKTCVNPVEVDDLLKPMLLKDLRIQCRARGLNPGGGRETLVERLRENILSSGDLTIFTETMCNGIQSTEPHSLGTSNGDAALKNNYVRPEGQNMGNFITDRPSSRVLAPPGGGTSISLG